MLTRKLNRGIRYDPKECNCRSSNGNFGEDPEVILDPNLYFNWDDTAERIAVDACIAKQITALWKDGIWTRSSCCGHNKELPLVVIAKDADPTKAKRVLEDLDPHRKWEVKQWNLTKV